MIRVSEDVFVRHASPYNAFVENVQAQPETPANNGHDQQQQSTGKRTYDKPSRLQGPASLRTHPHHRSPNIPVWLDRYLAVHRQS